MSKWFLAALALALGANTVSAQVSAATPDPTQVIDDPFAPDDETGDPFAAPSSPAETKISAKPVASFPTRIWASPGEAANEPIRAALAKPLESEGLDFNETALEQVLEDISDAYRIEIQIDLPALDCLGLRSDEPMICRLHNMTLGAALRLMLQQLELAAVPRDGYLLITTQEEAATLLIVAVYPVGDLIAASGRTELADAIFATVAAETWAENGGGEAEIRILANGVMIVSQYAAVHDKVVLLLEAMRSVPATRLTDPAAVRDLENQLEPSPPPSQNTCEECYRQGGGLFGATPRYSP